VQKNQSLGTGLYGYKMKRVAVIGSGFAGYGAIVALQRMEDVEIHLIDIGLTKPLPGQADNVVPNAKKCNGSYFPYGINDSRSPVKLFSERICSSHAFGGYSTVYSGAICYPKNSDLGEWPSDGRPLGIDYRAILESMCTWYDHDALDTQFPMPPSDSDLDADSPRHNFDVLGLSRIATNRPVDHPHASVSPFNTGTALSRLIEEGRVVYHTNCYVEKIVWSGDTTKIHYQCAGEIFSEAFDAIFVGAGCVNTTGIIDRSLFGEGEREYSLRMTTGIILAFLRLSLRPVESTSTRQLNNLPGFFLKIVSPLTGRAWSHTQISALNEQIVESICSRLPALLHPVVRLTRHIFYFALCGAHSRFGQIATIRCTTTKTHDASLTHRIVVEETPSSKPIKGINLGKAVRKAVVGNWRTLRMIPVPFSQMLGSFFSKNQLGGWHLGGTLPMSNSPVTPTECLPSGEVNGLRNVFVVDSAAFPTVPSSTVALLIAAHAHRVARQRFAIQPNQKN
jgi:hypothetical protein